MKCLANRPAVASMTLLVTASLAVGGCGSTGNSPAASCLSKLVQPAAPGAAAGWTLPGANLQDTRDGRQSDHQLECLDAGSDAWSPVS